MIDLEYSDVERHLRDSVRALLADRAPWQAVLAGTETAQPYDQPQWLGLWRALALDMGIAGLPVPESDGGHGGSWRQSAVVAEELGASVAPTPFLGSAVLATAAALAVGATEIVRELAGGVRTGALAVPADTYCGTGFAAAAVLSDGRVNGAIPSVLDASTADILLVPARDGDRACLVAVAAEAAQRSPVTSLDMTRPLTDVAFAAAPCQILGTDALAQDAVDAALRVGAAILASEQLGIAQRCLDMTVSYVQTRYQFGRPIGSYQALKHRLADLWSAVSQARAVARYAAGCVSDGDPDAAVAASVAQAYCSGVAVRAAEECVQLHGGIGFTWEHPAHLYLKRAKADAVILGSAAAHRARLGTLVDLVPA